MAIITNKSNIKLPDEIFANLISRQENILNNYRQELKQNFDIEEFSNYVYLVITNIMFLHLKKQLTKDILLDELNFMKDFIYVFSYNFSKNNEVEKACVLEEKYKLLSNIISYIADLRQWE